MISSVLPLRERRRSGGLSVREQMQLQAERMLAPAPVRVPAETLEPVRDTGWPIRAVDSRCLDVSLPAAEPTPVR
jgi:hypothetical protein